MNRPISLRIAALSGAAFALSLAGCKKPEIRVYTIPKEMAAAPQPPPAASKAADDMASAAPRPRPQLDYKLPAGWQDAGPSQFSLVNFRVPTPNGEAMVNITPLANMVGKDAIIVNMWREQMGEPPLEEPDAEASLKPVEVGGEQGKLFEVSATRDGQAMEIITAFVHRPDGSWFYKIQGPADVVAAQKTAFLDFLKTVKVKAGVVEMAATNPPSSPPDAKASAEPAVHLMAPEGWKEQPAGAMQVAKFAVEKDGGKADVSVSIFPSDTGGMLLNVNRWRRQIGLEETDENGLQECVTTLGGAHFDGAPGPVLVNLSNDNRGLLGAIVPREGQWWFYKMLGDVAAVNAEHDAFVQFVKSQP